jgi:hypothetical protein
VSRQRRDFVHVAQTYWDFATRLSLYRLWVLLHNDGKAPLASIWIDPALATFVPQETTAHVLEEHGANDADRLAGEHRTWILSRRS